MNIFHVVLVLASIVTGEIQVMQSEETWSNRAACEAALPAFKADIDAKVAANEQMIALQVQARVACMSESELKPSVGV